MAEILATAKFQLPKLQDTTIDAMLHQVFSSEWNNTGNMTGVAACTVSGVMWRCERDENNRVRWFIAGDPKEQDPVKGRVPVEIRAAMRMIARAMSMLGIIGSYRDPQAPLDEVQP